MGSHLGRLLLVVAALLVAVGFTLIAVPAGLISGGALMAALVLFAFDVKE